MTECERLVSEGFISSSFLEQEIRSGIFVDSERKRVWAILLDLYRELTRVCNKFGLEYYAVGGAAIGAVRHKGFIPWDDDIDLLMPRKSYNKLISLAKEFNHPYFLQDISTDPEYGCSYIRIRNSNTTVFEGAFNEAKFNHGIFLDIDPLDRVENYEDAKARQDRANNLIVINSATMRYNRINKTPHDIEVIKQFYDPDNDMAKIVEEVNSICSEKEETDAPFLCQIQPSLGFPIAKKIWRKEIFDETCELPFENIMMRLPKKYDEFLTVNFGNYMQMPPVEDRVAHTFNYDTETSYLNHIKE